MYASTKEILNKALKNNYAVCAFNAENLEMMQAIVAGAEEKNAPVILQTTPSTIKYANCELFAAIAKTIAKSATVPVALHLDHGNSFELAAKAIKAGYSSIMIDGSQKSFEENIKITQKVIELAHSLNIPVEAELGKVGGKEDDLENENESYADPNEAKIFAETTGCDSLAVGIGTAHGLYKVAPKLDLDRLVKIRELVKIPLVLHGATGLSDEVVKECVKRGMNKINFATELRLAYTNAVREKLNSDLNILDVKIYNNSAREAVKNLVCAKIDLSGSAGKC